MSRTTVYEVEPPPESSPQLRQVSAEGLATAELSPPAHAINPHVPEGVASLLGGHGGAGKTMLAEIWTAHAACGQSWAGVEIRRTRTLFVSLEDPARVVLFRLRKIVAAYALPMAEVEAGITILDGSDSDAALVFEHSDAGVRRIVPTAALEQVRAAAPGHGLIIVDGASDAFDGDENNRRQVRAFVRMLAKIAKDNSAGLLLLAHLDKHAVRNGSGGESYSGSTGWHNSVRSRLALVELDGRIELRHEKANLGKKADPIALTWSDDGVLVPVGGDSGSRLAAAAITADADAAALLVVIADAEARGVMVPVGRTGPATTWHCLSTLPGFPEALRDKAARLRFWAGLDLLQVRGRIVRETYKDHRRHDKERWTTRAGTGADAPVDAPESARHTSPHTPLPEPAQGRRCADSGVAPENGTRANPRKPAQPGCTAAEYLAAREGA